MEEEVSQVVPSHRTSSVHRPYRTLSIAVPVECREANVPEDKAAVDGEFMNR